MAALPEAFARAWVDTGHLQAVDPGWCPAPLNFEASAMGERRRQFEALAMHIARDVAMTVADYAVDDAPELDGLDVPMQVMTAGKARAVIDPARPMVADIYTQRYNSQPLAIALCLSQIVFGNAPIIGLDDLNGLKLCAARGGKHECQLWRGAGCIATRSH